MSVGDRITIVHQVLVDFEKHGDVASEWRVSTRVVQALVKKAETDKRYLEELIHDREAKRVRREVIEQIIRKNVEVDAFIDSAESIKR